VPSGSLWKVLKPIFLEDWKEPQPTVRGLYSAAAQAEVKAPTLFSEGLSPLDHTHANLPVNRTKRGTVVALRAKRASTPRARSNVDAMLLNR
jgi:hypothetical protein